MFRGISQITMDAKGRVALPTQHRKRLQQFCGGQIVVTVHTQRKCLMVYPLPTWEQIESSLLSLQRSDPSSSAAMRMVVAHATDFELDDTARIVVPQKLRERCNLSKALVLVGSVDRFELWSEAEWDKHSEAEFGVLCDPDIVSDDVLNLGV